MCAAWPRTDPPVDRRRPRRGCSWVRAGRALVGPREGAPAGRALAELLHGTSGGIAFNKHFGGDGMIVFRHACALGCEGIVSKRLSSHYRSGRVDHWLKIKNPAAPATKREAEEDWGEKRWGRGRRRTTNSE